MSRNVRYTYISIAAYKTLEVFMSPAFGECSHSGTCSFLGSSPGDSSFTFLGRVQDIKILHRWFKEAAGLKETYAIAFLSRDLSSANPWY